MSEAKTDNPASGEALQAKGSFLARVVLDVTGRWGARLGLAWVAVLIVAAVFAPFIANSRPFLWKVDGAIASPMLAFLTGIDVALLAAFALGVVLMFLRRISATIRWGWWLIAMAALVPLVFRPGIVDIYASFLPGGEGGPAWIAALFTTLGLAACALVLVKLLIALASHRGTWIILGAAVVVGAPLAVIGVEAPADQGLRRYRDAINAGQVDWAWFAPIPFSPSDRQRDVLEATGDDPRLIAPDPPRHWMGTTTMGADLFSRMIHASRIALTIGLIATGIAATIGIAIGGLMGYFSGRVDLLGMRLVEVFSAIPVIFLLIMIVAFYGRSIYIMTVVLGLTGWVGYALYVRAEFLKIRSMDFVQAARAAGLPLRSILFRHMLPNGITPVLVLASFGIAAMILTEATLSFIGLGVVDQPSWGQMLNEARASGSEQWGLVVFPGLAIFLTVFAYNLIGEALRDAIDPHTAE